MLTNRAMLVDLGISVWTARKLDRKVSTEVDQDKGARTRAGNYHKNLLAGSDMLAGIQKLANEIRTYHYTNTLPWSDMGTRLLPASRFMEYNSWMHGAQTKFDLEVKAFLDSYPTVVSGAAFVMGQLFSRDDYPSVDSVASKFRFVLSYTPVPESGDFRVDIEAEAKAQLQEQYKNYYRTKIEEAMADAWGRLHTVLEHMSDRLDFTDENKKRVFESLLGNANELCGLLTHLNIKQDPDLEQARQDLERALSGVTTRDIKDDAQVRHRLKCKVDEIASRLEF